MENKIAQRHNYIQPNKDNHRMRLFFDERGVSCLIIKRLLNGQSDVDLGEVPKNLTLREIYQTIDPDKTYVGYRTWDDLAKGNI